MLLLPLASLSAQNNDDIDEKLYLAGAVPEKDGKVVFSREFSIPGMSEEDIFNRKIGRASCRERVLRLV